MAVMRSGKLWGISYCVTFTLKVKYIKKSKLNMTVGEDGVERATDTRTEAADIHEKHLTSGLKPFVKAFMRLRVVPSSTPLQLRSTLNKAWVAHEFGISWTEK